MSSLQSDKNMNKQDDKFVKIYNNPASVTTKEGIQIVSETIAVDKGNLQKYTKLMKESSKFQLEIDKLLNIFRKKDKNVDEQYKMIMKIQTSIKGLHEEIKR